MTEKKMTTTALETQELFAGGLQVCGYTFLRLYFLAIIPYLCFLCFSSCFQGTDWELEQNKVAFRSKRSRLLPWYLQQKIRQLKLGQVAF